MKRGAHRAHLALHSGTSTHSITLTLLKGARSRVMEDELASRLVIKVGMEWNGYNRLQVVG